MSLLLRAVISTFLLLGPTPAMGAPEVAPGPQPAPLEAPGEHQLWVLIRFMPSGNKVYALDSSVGLRRTLAEDLIAVHQAKKNIEGRPPKELVEPSKSLDASVDQLTGELAKVDAELGNDPKHDPVAHGLVDPARWLEEKGARILILCIAEVEKVGGEKATAVIKVDEKGRKSRIESDLYAFLAAMSPGAQKAVKPPKWLVGEHAYTLRESRAVVTITATVNVPLEGKDTLKETASCTRILNTGGREILYLSLDIPFKDVTVTRDLHAGAKSTKPESILLSLNWMLCPHADLGRVDASPASPVLKVFAKPSGNPLDQFGVGVGWRFGGGFFGGLTVHAGWEWNREERTSSGGGKTYAYPGQVTFGAGFNLDRAVAWLKK